MADPITKMTSRSASYWAQNLRYLLSAHGMNYWKFLCLQWQQSTGKRCTNRAHQNDEYKRTLECEAQLTECLVIASQGGGRTCKELAPVLLSIHAEMGCTCSWRPKLQPPKDAP